MANQLVIKGGTVHDGTGAQGERADVGIADGRITEIGANIGHTALRLFVMGDDAYERTAAEEECAAMQAVLREAMDAGAAGFATSFATPHRGIDGKPVPSRFADRAELEALLETMSEVG